VFEVARSLKIKIAYAVQPGKRNASRLPREIKRLIGIARDHGEALLNLANGATLGGLLLNVAG
jgi:hypothetical protein